MYDLLFVRKRRRRRIAALISLISAIGISSLVLISFLGRTVGTFTVSLTNTTVRLALSEKQDFNESTTFLRIEKLYRFEEFSYENLPRSEVLDNEDKKTLDPTILHQNPDTGEVSMDYFKYTFYVKNVGSKAAQYNMSITIDDKNKSDDGTERTLDDTLRVMVYENDPHSSVSSDPHIYAKAAAVQNIDKDGKPTYRELVYCPYRGFDKEDDEHPLAETFYSSQTVAKWEVPNFKYNDIRRYTLVIWLEGSDPQSENSKLSPDGASIKLGVKITAYENE